VADARRGDADATARLVPLLYDELRHIAAGLMARERNAATLQPTALVHEAYLRLLGTEEREWQSRAHFLGAAAQAMRRILVEHARKRSRLKRGGDRERITLSDGHLQYEAQPEDLMALEQALVKLEARDNEMARVVELRYFGGNSACRNRYRSSRCRRVGRFVRRTASGPLPHVPRAAS